MRRDVINTPPKVKLTAGFTQLQGATGRVALRCSNRRSRNNPLTRADPTVELQCWKGEVGASALSHWKKGREQETRVSGIIARNQEWLGCNLARKCNNVAFVENWM